MSRIGVIAAPNPGLHNPGMISVDVALQSFISSVEPSMVLKWYTLHPPGVEPLRPCVDEHTMPIRYHRLAENFQEVLASDAILFWGDFLQARHYHVQGGKDRAIKFGYASTVSEALAFLRRHLLFEGVPEAVLRRTVLFGGSIVGNVETDYSDQLYRDALVRLLRCAGSVWVRDVFSAAKVADLRGEYAASHLGVDGSLLAPGDSVAFSDTGWADHVPEKGAIGVFLGSRTKFSWWGARRFLTALSRELDASLDWLPWFGGPPPSPLKRGLGRSRWIDRQGEEACSTGDLFEGLKRYRLVVSDTYHLCLNAWHNGTPAVCIGTEAAAAQSKWRSLHDIKKLALYRTYEANEFYLDVGTLEASQRRRPEARRIAHLVKDGSAVQGISNRMHRHAAAAGERLLTALRRLTGPEG